MSYILEALKKSEQQRCLGAVPRLDTIQGPPPGPAAAGPGWQKPLLVLNLLLVAALLGYLLLPPAISTEPEPAVLRAEVERASAAAEKAAAEPRQPVLVENSSTSAIPPSPPPPALPPARAALPPRLSELPADLRQQLTPPHLEVHVYSETPARRFVMIRGALYREGDTLPNELRLDEITPAGAILSRHGEPFLLER